jgi:hypothetical protein
MSDVAKFVKAGAMAGGGKAGRGAKKIIRKRPIEESSDDVRQGE